MTERSPREGRPTGEFVPPPYVSNVHRPGDKGTADPFYQFKKAARDNGKPYKSPEPKAERQLLGLLGTNAAMVVSRPQGMAPRALAELLAERLRAEPDVTEVTIAGPGFLNWRLADRFWHERLREMLRIQRLWECLPQRKNIWARWIA